MQCTKKKDKFYYGPIREDSILNQAVIFGFWEKFLISNSIPQEKGKEDSNIS